MDADVVSIFYTSGSTGSPKGVVLSHRNMVAGAVSVSTYLANVADDSLLAVLPFSFDYGFSQLSTARIEPVVLPLVVSIGPLGTMRPSAGASAAGTFDGSTF